MLLRDKKGLSIMIGYVLLIAGAIAMGAVVFMWMKSYVPTDTQECDDGVSILVKEYECITDNGIINLNITLKNTGRFSIEGFFIRASSTGDGIADTSLSDKIIKGGIDGGGRVFIGTIGGGGRVFIGTIGGKAKNNFGPTDDEKEFIFKIPLSEMSDIKFIELIPTRNQKINEKNRLLTCTDAKIKEYITCSESD